MFKETHNFENLIVWQKSVDLTEEIYFLTKNFPREELYGLTSQMRRAAFSIPLNISEGQGRKSKKEFTQFLLIARGSAYELTTALLISLRLHYLSEENYNQLRQKIRDIIKLLNGLINYLK